MFSNEDRLDYQHKAYANSKKAWRRANPDWEEQERKSEEYAEKWDWKHSAAYKIGQERLEELSNLCRMKDNDDGMNSVEEGDY